ncbi:hypothetical protein PRVXT_000637 [Proteinivorax tanatarense]|uniref:DUF3784 domain-containing protein n=1 Tax=Proteinivorax tanatarense TaxID=1260629 RepID=A0AAU7VNJ6_9FIRM
MTDSVLYIGWIMVVLAAIINIIYSFVNKNKVSSLFMYAEIYPGKEEDLYRLQLYTFILVSLMAIIYASLILCFRPTGIFLTFFVFAFTAIIYLIIRKAKLIAYKKNITKNIP